MTDFFSNDSRVTQSNIIPTAIKTRNLGKIVLESNTSTSTSPVLANGDQVVFSITTEARSNARIFCVPDIALYVNTATVANQLPGGTGVDESKWQVIFMGNDLISTDGNNVKTLVYVRNISNGSSTVIIQTFSRVIVNTAI